MEETGAQVRRQPDPSVDPARGGLQEGAESRPTTPRPEDGAGTSDAPGGRKELLCTICGLRACWE